MTRSDKYFVRAQLHIFAHIKLTMQHLSSRTTHPPCESRFFVFFFFVRRKRGTSANFAKSSRSTGDGRGDGGGHPVVVYRMDANNSYIRAAMLQEDSHCWRVSVAK